ncbi:2S sulfur-rich seed storage protein 2-like [Hibiscus syriacus]|uniref:2S sulfur-rich seed storage protein 2-like n=1 Tax=Hibiscus syriacus TaxID=106335 RepID=UPI001924E9DC|nr:2S sulfur-rich seed storage protein 2-like [Hibiscus syriacus]
MAKLALLVATFALAFFVVNASIYRHQDSCQQQIREEDNLRYCQRYIENESSRRYNRADRHLDSCCQQLENLERDCRCDGLEQAVKQQLEEGDWEREEAQELYKVAEKILQRCDNVEEPRRCDLPSRRCNVVGFVIKMDVGDA